MEASLRKGAQDSVRRGSPAHSEEKHLATFGAAVVLVLILTSIFADVIAQFEPNQISLKERLAFPSWEHLLGTDQLGRDLFSRIVYGARISVIVGLSAAAVDTVVAGAIGIISGYVGGKLDLSVQRFVDAWMSFPGLVIILTIMAVLGPGMIQIIAVIGVSAGIRSSRVVRGATISVKENVYILAAHAIGCSTYRMLSYHVLPNVMAPIIIIFTIAVGGADPVGGQSELPGVRSPASRAELGQYAEPRRSHLHAPGAVAIAVAGSCTQHRRLRRQRAWRRTEGRTRSQTQRHR